jgi:hypothetical protein
MPQRLQPALPTIVKLMKPGPRPRPLDQVAAAEGGEDRLPEPRGGTFADAGGEPMAALLVKSLKRCRGSSIGPRRDPRRSPLTATSDSSADERREFFFTGQPLGGRYSLRPHSRAGS